jgi:hypothetical protein
MINIVNDRIQIFDKKGTPFIYDCAINDLEKFDAEAIKILTR